MRVLFVCTGNLIRSPLAEYLFRRQVEQAGLSGIAVASAGTHAVGGSPALPDAIRAGLARGVDLTAHRSTRFEPGMLRPDDRILVMEHMHHRHIRILAQDPAPRVELLGMYAPEGGEEVGDPFGRGERDFAACVDRLARCLDGLLGALRGEAGR